MSSSNNQTGAYDVSSCPFTHLIPGTICIKQRREAIVTYSNPSSSKEDPRFTSIEKIVDDEVGILSNKAKADQERFSRWASSISVHIPFAAFKGVYGTATDAKGNSMNVFIPYRSRIGQFDTTLKPKTDSGWDNTESEYCLAGTITVDGKTHDELVKTSEAVSQRTDTWGQTLVNCTVDLGTDPDTMKTAEQILKVDKPIFTFSPQHYVVQPVDGTHPGFRSTLSTRKHVIPEYRIAKNGEYCNQSKVIETMHPMADDEPDKR
ncbi:uncharacterized protein I206_105859 [Kwoniella pini CBS 10737]|uniref:Uncharacterized protein n=1 Tax=Kwoniella pini CBS 10737 TaxID=1296096 RepID=A0A1B9I0D0_9TREE|nr:uncharacterized protein I206_04679 [Kwoniella pini CBS 10737]OCF48992.1 hypothetical protein I206_04679 [Kwoniella pini CBS 10737]